MQSCSHLSAFFWYWMVHDGTAWCWHSFSVFAWLGGTGKRCERAMVAKTGWKKVVLKRSKLKLFCVFVRKVPIMIMLLFACYTMKTYVTIFCSAFFWAVAQWSTSQVSAMIQQLNANHSHSQSLWICSVWLVRLVRLVILKIFDSQWQASNLQDIEDDEQVVVHLKRAVPKQNHCCFEGLGWEWPKSL